MCTDNTNKPNTSHVPVVHYYCTRTGKGHFVAVLLSPLHTLFPCRVRHGRQQDNLVLILPDCRCQIATLVEGELSKLWDNTFQGVREALLVSMSSSTCIYAVLVEGLKETYA